MANSPHQYPVAGPPWVGIGMRSELSDWLMDEPACVECVELTAEHFFDAQPEWLPVLTARYPLCVHGLGLSLGTPGPLCPTTLDKFCSVVEQVDPLWVSEHIAFTRAGDIDLGHLNPVPHVQHSLNVLSDHVKELSDRVGKPVLLENITTSLQLPGEYSETEFLNRLCDQSDCGLLLDVTNLYINSKNQGFAIDDWLDQLNLDRIVQLHIVGYSRRAGRYFDRHRDPIQPELYELVENIVSRANISAVTIERDVDIPSPDILEHELTRLAECVRSTSRNERNSSGHISRMGPT